MCLRSNIIDAAASVESESGSVSALPGIAGGSAIQGIIDAGVARAEVEFRPKRNGAGIERFLPRFFVGQLVGSGVLQDAFFRFGGPGAEFGEFFRGHFLCSGRGGGVLRFLAEFGRSDAE